MTHETNRGYGGALLSGFAAATRQWVFYTDGDAQFDPTELALLVDAAADDVDVVQGYKIRRADNLARRVIGRVYHRFVSFVFGLQIRDTDCDFRLIRKSALDRITLVHTTGVICVELVRKLQDAGARFVEVPVHHYAREHGQSQFFRFTRVASSLHGPRRSVVPTRCSAPGRPCEPPTTPRRHAAGLNRPRSDRGELATTTAPRSRTARAWRWSQRRSSSAPGCEHAGRASASRRRSRSGPPAR